MRLTAAGQTAYEHTTAIFRSGERLEQVLADKPDDAPVSLRVGTSGSVARATSTDFLLPLFALDGCMPVIRIGDTVELIRDLRGNELDLVLCETEPAESSLEGLQHAVVDHIPLVVIAPADRELPPDWSGVRFVQYRTSSNFYWEVARFLEAQNLKPEIVGEADDPFLMVEAVARSSHLAIVPTSVARDAIAAGRVRALMKLDSAHAGVHALYQDGSSGDLVRHAIERLISATKPA
jgi:DNA-binding transcriptional LysR family regulator